MKTQFFLLAFLLGVSGRAQAQSVSIDAGLLENSNGTAPVQDTAPTPGLLQLIASPTGTFSAPNSSSYVSGDNVLVASFAMNYNGGTAGETSNTVSVVSTSAAPLASGEELLLRFYPSLTYNTNTNSPTLNAPTLGTSYGQVRSDTVEFSKTTDSSETAWVVPVMGSVDLDYITSNDGGTTAFTPASAFASNTVGVVPEPSTCLFAGAFLGLTILYTRKRLSGAM